MFFFMDCHEASPLAMTKMGRHFCKFAESRNDEAKRRFQPLRRHCEAIYRQSNPFSHKLQINRQNRKEISRNLWKIPADSAESSDKMDCHSPKGLRNDDSVAIPHLIAESCLIEVAESSSSFVAIP